MLVIDMINHADPNGVVIAKNNSSKQKDFVKAMKTSFKKKDLYL